MRHNLEQSIIQNKVSLDDPYMNARKRDSELRLDADGLIISDYMMQNSIRQTKRNSRNSKARKEFRVKNYIKHNEI